MVDIIKFTAMYRTVFTPTERDNTIPINIPREWYGRNIEVIVFPLDTQQKKQSTMEIAAERLYEDYMTDENMTIFTQLDYEDFYEAR